MGQIETYELLKCLRLTGDHRYFDNKQIHKFLQSQSYKPSLHVVRMSLIKLEDSGYLEIKMSGGLRDWRRTYRLKEKYCVKKDSSVISSSTIILLNKREGAKSE